MARPKLSVEEKKRRKQDRDRKYKAARYVPRPIVKLTEEQKKERKRMRDTQYRQTKRNEEKRSMVQILAESTKRGRVCRHDRCTRNTAVTSYYFCAEHKEMQDWGDEIPLYTLIGAEVV